MTKPQKSTRTYTDTDMTYTEHRIVRTNAEGVVVFKTRPFEGDDEYVAAQKLINEKTNPNLTITVESRTITKTVWA